MGSTPTGCGKNLPTIMILMLNPPESKSENNLFKCPDVTQIVEKRMSPAKAQLNFACNLIDIDEF